MKKFWIGDVPLSVAYWVYGWLLPMGLALAFVILGITLVPGSVPARLFLLGLCCYIVFWGVGTWRAATRYQGLKLWGVLAKAHIVAPLVLLVFSFATLAVVRTNQGAALSHAVREPSAESPGPLGLNAGGGALREKFARPITQPQSPEAAGMGDENRAGAMTSPELPAQQIAPALPQPSEQGVAKMDLDYFRQRIPELRGLDDNVAVDLLQKHYYPNVDRQEIADALGVKPVERPTPERLGWLDQRRYESCQQDAAKAPTPQGVVVGLRICREKFGQ